VKPGQLLFLLFISVPIIEIYFLIQMSDVIGGWYTIALVIVTAMAGARLVRSQGVATTQKMQLMMAQGQMPAMEILEGVVILVAGVLLVTPGFFTDAIGFIALLPPVRKHLIGKILKSRLSSMGQQAESPFQQTYEHRPSQTPRSPDVIEGDYRRED
jgi:UPF0716 protein FxsA